MSLILSRQQIEDALRILEDRPFMARCLSGEEEKAFGKRETERVIRICSVRLDKYLQSEEGKLTVKLFKQVWELPGTSDPYYHASEPLHTDGWMSWRVFLYRYGYHADVVDGEGIIWFGGNGLELYFREGRSNSFNTIPVTSLDLVTRMVTHRGNIIDCPISRPEQIVPFIRLNAMDLIHFLSR